MRSTEGLLLQALIDRCPETKAINVREPRGRTPEMHGRYAVGVREVHARCTVRLG